MFDTDGDGLSDPDEDWTIEDGADACPLISGTSVADRIGCLDSDGDGYSDEGDAFPLDPSRYEAEVEVEDASSGMGTTVIIIGVVVVILALIGGVILTRGRGDDETKSFAPLPTGSPPVAMPDFSAQPVMPDMSAQPAQAYQCRTWVLSLLFQT